MKIRTEDYKGVRVKKIEVHVTQEDAMTEIGRILKFMSVMVPVERTVIKRDDQVIADVKVFADGDEIKELAQDNVTIDVGYDELFDCATEQLIGKSIDDASFTVDYPEDYDDEKLCGKTAVYSLTVNTLREEQVPEFDDDFVKDATEFDTTEAYLAYMTGALQKSREEQALEEMENEAVKTVIDSLDLDGVIPEEMYEAEFEILMEEYISDLEESGVSFEDYLEAAGQTEQDVENEVRPMAVEACKRRAVLLEVAKMERLKATNAEIEKEIAEIAEDYEMDPEDFKKNLNKETRALIADDIALDKAAKYILGNAVLV